MTSNITIDLRSDTISQPTNEMREAMMTAKVGDDVYGEDPTVNELEKYAAELFGKEAALFVVSGTMGNLISVGCHCDVRGSEVFVGDQCHIYKYEQGGVAQLCGIMPRTLKNNEDGTFDIQELRNQFCTGSDPHKCVTRLVTIENTFNGRILPMDFMKEVRKTADELNILVHLDGARLMNAVAQLGVDPKEITKYVDSANICLSKGLCSPVGSIIVGSKELIGKARRMRKVLGGGFRQAGILAACGLLSLRVVSKKLRGDHQNASMVAQELLKFSPNYVSLDMKSVQTNMVFFKLNESLKTEEGRKTSADEFVHRIANPEVPDVAAVKCIHMGGNWVRMVFYQNITQDHAEKAAQAIRHIFSKWN